VKKNVELIEEQMDESSIIGSGAEVFKTSIKKENKDGSFQVFKKQTTNTL
jgi:hypothetical protein